MRTIEEAKELLEGLRCLQEETTESDHVFPCPRCGRDRMDPKAARNALSRRADVYICSECGMDEALRDTVGEPPLPLNEWGIVRGFDEDESEES